MKNFFIKASEVKKIGGVSAVYSVDQLSEGIYSFKIKSSSGWVVEENFLDTVLRIIPARGIEEKQTEYEGIFSLSLEKIDTVQAKEEKEVEETEIFLDDIQDPLKKSMLRLANDESRQT